jgi:hypothetical protein
MVKHVGHHNRPQGTAGERQSTSIKHDPHTSFDENLRRNEPWNKVDQETGPRPDFEHRTMAGRHGLRQR